MKVKSSILLLVLISFLNMGAVSNKHIINKSFNELETTMMDKSEFQENGVKVQFKTKNDIESEYLKVNKILMNNIQGDYKKSGKNSFKILNNNLNIDVNLWNIDSYTYVEVILTNINSEYKTSDLKEVLKKFKNEDNEDMQTFLYYKGKINKKENKIIKDNTLEDFKYLDIIEINNGYTGTGELKDGEDINFALANYNTDSYIIIGTPIIFTTY